jgi:S-adenosylmethionine decarboxylase
MKEIIAKKLDAKVFSLKGWINLIDHHELIKFFNNELEIADFTILNLTQHTFPYNGFTAVWLLAESHLAIHTFTDSGWTFLELTSCNKSKSEVFKMNILKSSYHIKLDRDTIEESEV